MATTPTGLIVPAGTDVFDPDGDMRDLATSLEGRIIVPVANTTDRATLAAAVSPTPTEPLYAHRIDAPAGRELERTLDGTNWRPVGARIDIAGTTSPDAWIKAGDVVAPTNAGGDGQIVFAEAFPVQMYTAILTDATDKDVLGPVLIKYTAVNSDRTRITFRAYSSSGVPLANSEGLRIAYIAMGR